MIQANQIHEVMKQYTIGDGEQIVIDLERSLGSYIADQVTGQMYLDCSSQFASLPVGWNHPRLKNKDKDLYFYAIHKIANSDYYTVPLANFTQKFASIAPDFKHFFFVEGGTLGVENALKAAFDWKAKKLGYTESVYESCDEPLLIEEANQLDVIHLREAFHGRSGYTLSLTNTIRNKTALFPKFGWSRIPNPKIRFPMVESDVLADEALSLECAEAILGGSETVAAIILETIQSEGGDNHFRPEYFKALRQLADKYGVMLILDEVQTGVGLTGKMWAYEHMGIVPDMIAFGKKTQVCGFASTTRIDEVPNNVFTVPSRINSTWGGNIIDMVRFSYIIDIIRDEKLVENAAAVGQFFLDGLRTVPGITNVRGRGLLIAFDLETPERRNQVLSNMLKKMTALPCGERSIRLRPSLTFCEDDATKAHHIIADSVAA